jgi:flagellin FlaB
MCRGRRSIIEADGRENHKPTMFNTNSQVQERGQVGIGTLIVFIALVLVAAIAAGVLINTAGFLQTQAEDTGQESTNQVSNNVQVVSSTATTISSGEVTQVETKLSLAPGADPIDLSLADVQVIGPAGTSSASVTGTLSEPQDTQTLTMDFGTGELEVGSVPSSGNTEFALAEGDTIEVRITVASGGQVIEQFTIPDPIDPDKSALSL